MPEPPYREAQEQAILEPVLREKSDALRRKVHKGLDEDETTEVVQSAAIRLWTLVRRTGEESAAILSDRFRRRVFWESKGKLEDRQQYRENHIRLASDDDRDQPADLTDGTIRTRLGYAGRNGAHGEKPRTPRPPSITDALSAELGAIQTSSANASVSALPDTGKWSDPEYTGVDEGNEDDVDDLSDRTFRERFREQITKLSPRRRQVMEMRLDDVSYEEIAKRLSIAPKTAEKHYELAVKDLKARLAPERRRGTPNRYRTWGSES